MTKPVCVVAGAGTKYASNEAFFGNADASELPQDVKWGLGGALPIAFAEQGYNVVVLSRTYDNLVPIAEHIEATTEARCLALECDVSDPTAVSRVFADIEAQLGPVEVLCYNAGYDQSAQIAGRNPMAGSLTEDIDVERFDKAQAVHVSGLLYCAQAVLPGMRERGTGGIYVSGNTMSFRGSPKFGVNAPSKFAQRGLVQVMAQEYKEYGVHVGLVIIDGTIDAPGIREMFAQRGNTKALQAEFAEPGSKLLKPAEVANAFVYLAQQHHSIWSHEITLTPQKVRLGHRL